MVRVKNIENLRNFIVFVGTKRNKKKESEEGKFVFGCPKSRRCALN